MSAMPVSVVSPPLTARLVLCHKQATSARLRFFCHGDSILVFDPLPPDRQLHDEDFDAGVEVHPAPLVQAAERRLGLAAGSITAEAGFHAWLSTAAGDVPVLLAAFQSTDPPFDAAERAGGRFIAMTDARRLDAIERELLRRVYEYLLG